MITVKADTSGLDKLEKEVEDPVYTEVLRILKNIGEEYIKAGKSDKGKSDFTDQTGNLRGAHSYAVYKDGELLAGIIGRTETLEMFEQLKKNEGWQFMVGDGIQYTSCVEGTGRDVCTSAFMLVERLIRENF